MSRSTLGRTSDKPGTPRNGPQLLSKTTFTTTTTASAVAIFSGAQAAQFAAYRITLAGYRFATVQGPQNLFVFLSTGATFNSGGNYRGSFFTQYGTATAFNGFSSIAQFGFNVGGGATQNVNGATDSSGGYHMEMLILNPGASESPSARWNIFTVGTASTKSTRQDGMGWFDIPGLIQGIQFDIGTALPPVAGILEIWGIRDNQPIVF